MALDIFNSLIISCIKKEIKCFKVTHFFLICTSITKESTNCANTSNTQCAATGSGQVLYLSMCVVPVKVQHEESNKEIITFAMLDTCTQGTFATENLMI